MNGFDPHDWIEKKDIKKCARFIQFAIAATRMAMDASGLQINDDNAARVGVAIGSGIGGFEVIEREHRILMERGPDRVSPFFILSSIVNLAAGQVSVRLGAKGPNSAVATACTTGAHAIGDAFRIIQGGYADAMICGGTEASITPLGVAGFAAMRALSTRNDDPSRASRPWDASRDGFVVGEGAGILVLEDLEHAVGRGAPILAELVGYGMSADAHHLTAPPEDGNGVVRAMSAALDDAGLAPADIQYLNAHATSTPLGDKAEATAIGQLFGANVAQARGQLDQVDDRAPARGRRRARSRHHDLRAARSNRAADDQSRRPRFRPRIRSDSSPGEIADDGARHDELVRFWRYQRLADFQDAISPSLTRGHGRPPAS